MRSANSSTASEVYDEESEQLVRRERGGAGRDGRGGRDGHADQIYQIEKLLKDKALLKEKLLALTKEVQNTRKLRKQERAHWIAAQALGQTELRWHLPAWASLFAAQEDEDESDDEEKPKEWTKAPPGQEWRTFGRDLYWQFGKFFDRLGELMSNVRSGDFTFSLRNG